MLSTYTVYVLAFVSHATAHGIFWSPTSRAQLAQLSGWEQDATSIISEPMPEVASGRAYPGGRPWSEPGQSVSNVGPCGMKNYGKKTNWNQPAHGWGGVQATYKAGDVVTMEWCVSDLADHGGVYSYRLCTDHSLVAKFTNPEYTPDAADMDALESCFQAGILACSDVPGQECPIHPDCQAAGTETWGCRNSTEWFNCGPKDNGRCASRGTHGSCETHKGPGTVLKDQVKLPDGFASNHTLIGFRWDCQDTPQLWLHCADVEITSA